jgi:FkbM family methyltransferase
MNEQPAQSGSFALRERVRALVRREAPDIDLEPPELGGLRLLAPRGYEGLFGEHYEPKMIAALTRLVRPGDVVADVGANVGYYTLLLAQLVGPHGRVVAFEPRDDMAGYFDRNVERSGLGDRIELRRAAVTDGAADSIELHAGAAGGEMRSTILPAVAEREGPFRNVTTVAAVALDDCFAPGDRLDVVKMDIEGGEAVAPLGARRILARQRPALVVEFHRDHGWPVIGHLAAAGYRFERFDGTRIATPAAPAEVPSYFVAVPA